jgi:HEPN domain-containing protein
MSERADLIRAVSDWIGKAEDDLAAASRLLEPEHAGPMWVVCFHAQQCAEKYIKALLTWRGVPFPKTHDVAELLQLIPEDVGLGIGSPDVAVLNPYAADARYPGNSGVVDRREAEGVLDLALRVREEIRRHLPPEAIDW